MFGGIKKDAEIGNNWIVEYSNASLLAKCFIIFYGEQIGKYQQEEINAILKLKTDLEVKQENIRVIPVIAPSYDKDSDPDLGNLFATGTYIDCRSLSLEESLTEIQNAIEQHLDRYREKTNNKN